MAKKAISYTIDSISTGIVGVLLDAATIKTFVGKEKRLVCTIKEHTIHCAIMRNVEHGYYIMLGKPTLKKIGLKLGDKVMASFEKDTTTVQFEENAILNEVLATDTDAKSIFDTLTPGNKRGLIYLVTQLKTEAKQIDRALLIAEKIKLGITTPRLVLKK
jgi:hypothetical protein